MVERKKLQRKRCGARISSNHATTQRWCWPRACQISVPRQRAQHSLTHTRMLEGGVGLDHSLLWEAAGISIKGCFPWTTTACLANSLPNAELWKAAFGKGISCDLHSQLCLCVILESLGVKANLPGNPIPALPAGCSPIRSRVGSCRWEGSCVASCLTDLEGRGKTRSGAVGQAGSMPSREKLLGVGSKELSVWLGRGGEREISGAA